MPNPAWDDLDDFLDLDEFAVKALHFQDGAEVGEVIGIFDAPGETAKVAEYELDRVSPEFTCKQLDASGINDGDTLQIDGNSYTVAASPEPDGTGLVKIELHVELEIYNAAL